MLFFWLDLSVAENVSETHTISIFKVEVPKRSNLPTAPNPEGTVSSTMERCTPGWMSSLFSKCDVEILHISLHSLLIYSGVHRKTEQLKCI